ncbi:MAG: response regulator [Alphaproteobacteria bacterium]|nr:response regulator [Alphaproteobacteria bacterium]
MKRCLVVDDSKIIRRVACKIFHELGFEPDEAENGKKALEATRIKVPEIAFVDWDMPVMNGLDYRRELRKLPGGDKALVIFCTAENDADKIQEALDAGADEYIMKPFDSEIVRSKLLIRGAIRLRRSPPVEISRSSRTASQATCGTIRRRRFARAFHCRRFLSGVYRSRCACRFGSDFSAVHPTPLFAPKRRCSRSRWPIHR